MFTNLQELSMSLEIVGYDAIVYPKRILGDIIVKKLEIKAPDDEIKQLNDMKTDLESTLKFQESRIEKHQQTMEIYYQLENMDFGLDKLIQLRDTLLEVAKY